MVHSSDSSSSSSSPRSPQQDLSLTQFRPSSLISPYSATAPNTIDRLRRVSQAPSSRYRREREQAHSKASHSELLRLLIYEEYESRTARKFLYTALERLDASHRHASSLEARTDETAQRCHALNEALMEAKLDAARARDELALYKVQYDAAQHEIFRAQDILHAVEGQRNEAEAIAAKARTAARAITEENLIRAAKEEGRKLGFEEGLKRGQRPGSDGWRDSVSDVYTLGDGASELYRDSLLLDNSEMRPESIRVRSPATASLGDAPPGSMGAGAWPAIARPSSQASTRRRRNSEASIPPDGWIPSLSGDSIHLPPPHELAPIPPASPLIFQNQPDNTESPRSRPVSRARRGSAADSISSRISQLDLVSFPNPSYSPVSVKDRNKERSRDKGKGLDIILEHSGSPAPGTTSGVGTSRPSGSGTDMWYQGSSEPATVVPSRTHSSLSISGHHRRPSSIGTGSGTASITIDVRPPSQSSSYVPDPGRSTPSAGPQPQPHLLSPTYAGIALPSQPNTQRQQPRFVEVPTVPNSPDRPTALWPPASPPADRSGSGIPFGSLQNDSGSHGPPVIPSSQPTIQIGERRMMSPANVVSTDHASSHGAKNLKMGSTIGGSESGRVTPNNAGIGAGGGMRGGVELHHMPSNTSLRSSKSYARYDPSTYLDPAYFE